MTLPPFLLSTPSWASGALDLGDLLDRLAEYQRLGIRAGAADFNQALLRLRPDPQLPPEAAANLGTPEGRRVAAWITAGCFPPPVCERTVLLPFELPDDPELATRYPKGWNLDAQVKASLEHWRYEREPWRKPGPPGFEGGPLEPAMIRVAIADATDRLAEFPEPFRSLAAAYQARRDHCGFWPIPQTWLRVFPQWLTVVPGHRELAVARTLTAVADGAERDYRECAAIHLPAVAEADGPAGPAVHLALAYGAGASSTAERIAAADALLILASRGELDTIRLGGDIRELVTLDGLKLKRVAETLRVAAQSGAPATVYAVLAEALPGVLPENSDRPRAGLQDLLTVVAECAETAPGRPPIPGVAALAERRGASQLLKAARRLHDTTP